MLSGLQTIQNHGGYRKKSTLTPGGSLNSSAIPSNSNGLTLTGRHNDSDFQFSGGDGALYQSQANADSSGNILELNAQDSNHDGVTLGASYGTGSAGAGSSSYDPTAEIEANDIISQARNALKRIGTQRSIGTSNIDGTYGNYRTGLENDFNRNEADYSQNRNLTIRDNEVAKSEIDQDVATRSRSLLNYMGTGADSAASRLAGWAAARSGTKRRNQVNQKFGSNLQGLDQSFNRYKKDHDDSLVSLGDQEQTARDSFEREMLQAELTAQDNLRQGESSLAFARNGDPTGAARARQESLPGLFEILSQIDSLGRQQITPTVRDASYNAPDLQSYLGEGIQDVAGVDQVEADSISPAYQYLLRKEKEKQTGLGY